MKNDIANKLFIMNDVTVERLFSLGADCFLLYSFYYKTAKWQNTTDVWATNDYVAKKLGWGEKKVRDTKKILEDSGFIKQVRVCDNTGKITSWNIHLEYIQHETTPSNLQQWSDKTTPSNLPVVEKMQPNNNIYINNNNNRISYVSNNNNNKEKEAVQEKENCDVEVDVDYFMKTWNGPFRVEIEDCTGTIVNFYEERIAKLKKAVKIVTPLLVGEWENFTPERYILRRVKHEILNSSYLRGYKENSRPVNVDFVLDNLEKILEGFYKD